MYFISKAIEISASHCLDLDYSSKCNKMHGHNYKIIVYVKSEKLSPDGMVCDFAIISNVVNQFDHTHLNGLLGQSTTEKLATRICNEMNAILGLREHRPVCYQVEIRETEGSIVRYVKSIENQ